MTAPTIPAQRTQIWPCETCSQPRRSALAVCVNALCLAAAIDYMVTEDERIEASDD